MALTADQLELAARRLCAERGQNPDEIVPYKDRTSVRERWKAAAEELTDFERKQRILQSVGAA